MREEERKIGMEEDGEEEGMKSETGREEGRKEEKVRGRTERKGLKMKLGEWTGV